MVKSVQVWTGNFATRDATGALATPSVGPAGALYVAGVADAASVTISGTNPYKWSVTLPTLTAGQSVGMYITATIAGIATASFVAEDIGDTLRISDMSTYAGGDTSGVTTLLARITALLQTKAEADTAHGLLATATAVDALPTNAELSTALGTADDAVLAAVAVIDDLVDDLESRLTATRAGYLDNLSGGALPTDAQLVSLVKSLARSDFAEDSDIGGTFDSATDSLQALRDFISSGDGSVVSTTTTRGDVTLIAGDDYNNTDGRAISWSVTNPGSISLSGATITFVADQAVNTAGVVTDFSDASITVTTATGSTLAFYLELTAVETATLMPGHYRYRVQAALATNARVITLATGVLTVTADYD